jgi:hypothetical protein
MPVTWNDHEKFNDKGSQRVIGFDKINLTSTNNYAIWEKLLGHFG